MKRTLPKYFVLNPRQRSFWFAMTGGSGNVSHPNRWRKHRGAPLSESDCSKESTILIVSI
ncbi:hypothetical protein HanPI659440_Chr01g0009121 [Helianthus annuus]|nr:hypothetical protein HanPI659440_Chr01g0009121 [Helianthus annuus]